MRRMGLALGLLAATLVPALLMAQGNEDKPFPPHKVIGNIYYVGTDMHSSFLVTTSAGNILIDSTYESNVPWIRDSVEKLGFKFTDIKILLTSHAHIDHCEGDAMVKEMTGATVMIMDRDVPATRAIQPGGKPHPIDRILHHLDRVTLGGEVLTAHLTPGHTEGTTTWTLQANEGGKTYDVVIPGSISPNGMTPVVNNKTYPFIAEDSLFMYKYLRILPCDVMLGSHTPFYHMQEKYAKIGKGPNPFIGGQQGCLVDIDGWEKNFKKRLAEDQKKASAANAQ